jgi:hypothetical protein
VRPKDVETWAVRVVEATRNSRRVEDSRVEFKADWPDAVKAARRIAGHLNASRGEAVLWLIGVDETGVIHDVAMDDFASWWGAVLPCFDGPRPRPVEVVIDGTDASYVALGIEGPTPPYLVKNPGHGSKAGDPVSLEVPWREMTSVRTARHADLMKILAPLARIPEVEVLDANLTGRGSYSPQTDELLPVEEGMPCHWDCELILYVVPADDRPVVLPAHRTAVFVRQEDTFGEIRLSPYVQEISGAHILNRADLDHVIEGPGRLKILAAHTVKEHTGTPSSGAILDLRVLMPWILRTLCIRCDLKVTGYLRYELSESEVSWQDS